jgi:hypothetical protein
MNKWNELRFWYSSDVTSEGLYAFKRDIMLPALDTFGVDKFLCLDQAAFMLIRICAADDVFDALMRQFESDLPTQFREVTQENWSPEVDARERIQAAKVFLSADDYIKKEEGWKILGRKEGEWLVAVEDMDKQVEAFSTFMSDVLGKFTQQYIESMPYMVEDRWLLSVFVHLMLDSISVWQEKEAEVREFPYV